MAEAFNHLPFAELRDKIRRERPDSVFARALVKVKDKASRRDGYKGVVQNTPEFSRIMNVPVRDLDLENVTDLTEIFRKPGGTMKLRPIQSAALIEAHIANGAFAPISVGQGKTLILLLMAEAMDSERTVLLVPSQLRDQLAREIDEVYGTHFNLPLQRIVRILSYSELSLAKNSGLLGELDPDLIVCDEVHNLRRKTSARTKRFLRHMRENPHCRFACMSGTMTNRSVIDYAHLIELALRKNSPLPNNWKELQLWAAALDVKPPKPADPGVLKLFCKEEDKGNVRLGYRRRLVSTLGVIASAENDIGTGLVVQNIKPDNIPADIVNALEEVKSTWAYNGEEFATPIAFWRFCRQISSGFYYRWVWPKGAPDEDDIAWLEARAAWKKAVREKLKTAGENMDSDLLLTNAAERWRKKIEDHSECEGEPVGEDHSECEYRVWTPYKRGSAEWNEAIGHDDVDENGEVREDFEPGEFVTTCQHFPNEPKKCTGRERQFETTNCLHYPKHPEHCTGQKTVTPTGKLFECEEYITWKKVKGRYNPTPPKEAVWISDFIVRDALRRAREYVEKDKEAKVIIWYVDTVVGDRLEELSGLPRFGAGADASPSKEDIILCSIATQGTGKNLQHYNTNITITMPTNGKDLEQQIGRTHRPLQFADSVYYYYYDHTESLDKCMNDCIADAMYIQDTNGGQQKILYADGEVIRMKRTMQLKQNADTALMMESEKNQNK